MQKCCAINEADIGSVMATNALHTQSIPTAYSRPQPRHSQPDPGQARRLRIWPLLLLTALGAMFGNLRLSEVGGFVITPTHITLVLIAVLLAPRFRYVNARLFSLWLLIVVIEIHQGLFAGGGNDPEWFKSFGQFLTYSACFLVITTLRIDQADVSNISSLFVNAGILLGTLSITQFLLFALGVSAKLPEAFVARPLDPMALTSRYGGFAPAFGLATEPAHHALGLVTLLAFVLFLGNVVPGLGKQKSWLLSLLLLLMGIVVSFSLSGILTAVALMLVLPLYSRHVRIRVGMLVAIGSVVLIVGGGVFEPIRSRLVSVSHGSDNSAMIRVVAATRLFFAFPGNLKVFMFGTGMGREHEEIDLYQRIYADTSIRDRQMDTVKMHNIFTVVKVMQGWVGVVLYVALLWSITRPMTFRMRAYAPLFMLLLLYQFSLGQLLSPFYWGTLGLLYLMRRLPLLGYRSDRQGTVETVS